MERVASQRDVALKVLVSEREKAVSTSRPARVAGHGLQITACVHGELPNIKEEPLQTPERPATWLQLCAAP